MADLGKIVIVSALDGTYQKKAFGRILELIPLSESVIKLNAVCMICNEDASFSKKIIETTNLETDIDIGGAEKYIACCRSCFKKTI